MNLILNPELFFIAAMSVSQIFTWAFVLSTFVVLISAIVLLVMSLKEQKSYDTFTLPSIEGIDDEIVVEKEVHVNHDEEVSAFAIDDDGDDDVFNERSGFRKDDFFDVRKETPRFGGRSKK